MDINAAVGGQAGLSREAIEAAGVKESSKLSEQEQIGYSATFGHGLSAAGARDSRQP
jgi:hypothetical protein